mgnify:CR=1 FL=1|jgi:RsiW-degrading membrane proteinase PrsW (M82 family)
MGGKNKMRKADEMERYQADKSTKILSYFYSLALLIWTFYDVITKGEPGIQFIILCVGVIIFFISLRIFKKKM